MNSQRQIFHPIHQPGAGTGAQPPPTLAFDVPRDLGARAEALIQNEQHRGLTPIFPEPPENAKLKGKSENTEQKYTIFYIYIYIVLEKGAQRHHLPSPGCPHQAPKQQLNLNYPPPPPKKISVFIAFSDNLE